MIFTLAKANVLEPGTKFFPLNNLFNIFLFEIDGALPIILSIFDALLILPGDNAVAFAPYGLSFEFR